MRLDKAGLMNFMRGIGVGDMREAADLLNIPFPKLREYLRKDGPKLPFEKAKEFLCKFGEENLELVVRFDEGENMASFKKRVLRSGGKN
ncbi:MAG: hypothetical protein LUD29_06055 [Clostridia bacterium]|nr:hypothetical protein [Clostridia bacterium]